MGRSKWQVIEGRGEQILSSISTDVERFNLYVQQLKPVTALVSGAERQLVGLTQRITSDLFSPEDIERRLDSLSPEELRLFARAHLAELVMGQLIEISSGKGFGIGKRAAITVIRGGVTRQKVNGDEVHGTFYKDLRHLEAGERLEGRILRFGSEPAKGGRLTIERGLAKSIVAGLVNPVTGESQVSLEILAKD